MVRSVRGGSGEGASSDTDALVHAAILGESSDTGLRVVVHLVHPGAAYSGTGFGLADLMLVRRFRDRRDAWELALLGGSIRSRRYRPILTPSAILYHRALVALSLLLMSPCRCRAILLLHLLMLADAVIVAVPRRQLMKIYLTAFLDLHLTWVDGQATAT